MGFRVSVSLLPATRVTGLWLLPRRACLPLNASAFPGRTVDHQLERGGLLDGEIGGLLNPTLRPRIEELAPAFC